MSNTGGGCVSLNLPFGMALTGSSAAQPGLTFDPMRTFLVQLNGVLTPFMPIFKIVGFAKDVLDALNAIPSCITKLSPAPLVQKMVKVAADIDELLGVLPPASVPVMLRDLLGALILFLSGVQSQLRGLQVQAQLVANLQSTADAIQSTNPDGYAELTAIVAASIADGTTNVSILDSQSCAYNELCKTIKIVAELVGLPAPPLLGCFNFGADLSPAAYNAAITAAVEAINVALALLGVLADAFGGATAPAAPC